MLLLVREHDERQSLLEQDADFRRREGIYFRELAAEYLVWVAEIKDAKPSTLSGYRYLLAEPGTPRRRGSGVADGFIMAALGDKPVAAISTRDVEAVLSAVAAPRASRVANAAGRTQTAERRVAPRTVNQHRQLMTAIFNYAMRPSTYGLAANPAKYADRRREPERGPLAYYTTEQIEALARSLERGAHRDPNAVEVGEEEQGARADEDARDAGWSASRPTQDCTAASSSRCVGATSTSPLTRSPCAGRSRLGVETSSTKSRRAREVPLPDQAAGALDRLSQRSEFVEADEFVFCNRLGRRLDATALRRRFERARDAAGLPRLRFHDLRHTYGSLLVAAGVDLQSIKAAMGHSRITTTERYLHARPATEQAARFTRAFAGLASAAGVPVDAV